MFVGTSRNSSCLSLFDAARFVVAAGTILKSMHFKLFHVTSIAMKVKSRYRDANQLIAKIKAKKNRQEILLLFVAHLSLFLPEGKACSTLYCAKNLADLKAIVATFEGFGTGVARF